MRVVVLLNRGAGTLAGGRPAAVALHLRQLFRAAGVDAEVHLVVGRYLAVRARQALATPADVVVAGGGDGTISTVAGVLAGVPRPLGVLPLGTLNHFARDAGVPSKLEEAVQIIAGGTPRPVDVGEVNGHVFVNNSSIGFYPALVQVRDEQRLRLGRNKWLAMASALLTVFQRYPVIKVRLEIGAVTLRRKTPLLFVGNNRYDLNLLSLGERAHLDRGELCLYLVGHGGRFAMVLLALRALLGLLEQSRDFEAMSLQECWVETKKHRLHVAVDGEVIALRPPLHYRVHPRALRVMLP